MCTAMDILQQKETATLVLAIEELVKCVETGSKHDITPI